MAEHILKDKEFPNNPNLKMIQTSQKGDWKFEKTILKDDQKFIRVKIYGKTADKLTSTGVCETDTKDPLKTLFLTNNLKALYDRTLLSTPDNFAVSRIEHSFYIQDSTLKELQHYIKLINSLKFGL